MTSRRFSMKHIGHRFDLYVIEMIELLQSVNGCRPGIERDSDELWQAASKTLEASRRWSKGIRLTWRTQLTSDFTMGKEHVYTLETLGHLLGRLDAISPMPPGLRPLLAVDPVPTRVRQEAWTLSQEGARQLSVIGLTDWLTLYSKTAALADEGTPFRLRAKGAIDKLSRRAIGSGRTWQSYRYFGHLEWTRGGYSGNNDPLSCALGEIRSRWLEFTTPDQSARAEQDAWMAYLRLVNKHMPSDLLEPLDTSRRSPNGAIYMDPRPIPVVRLLLDPTLRGLLDRLLLAEVRSHEAELSYWLRGLRSGRHPQERMRLPLAVSLFRKPNGNEFKLWFWQPVLRR